MSNPYHIRQEFMLDKPVVSSSVKIFSNPTDKNMLRGVKGITNANWVPWNARNPENPL